MEEKKIPIFVFGSHMSGKKASSYEGAFDGSILNLARQNHFIFHFSTDQRVDGLTNGQREGILEEGI